MDGKKKKEVLQRAREFARFSTWTPNEGAKGIIKGLLNIIEDLEQKLETERQGHYRIYEH